MTKGLRMTKIEAQDYKREAQDNKMGG